MEYKYKNLIKYLQTEHDLVLLDSEINDIEHAIDKDLKPQYVNGSKFFAGQDLFDYKNNTIIGKFLWLKDRSVCILNSDNQLQEIPETDEIYNHINHLPY